MKDIIVTSTESLSQLIEHAIRKVIKEELEQSSNGTALPKYEIVFLAEAMEITGLAKPTLYAKTSQNLIPHYKRGRKLYFKRSELKAWIEEGRQ